MKSFFFYLIILYSYTGIVFAAEKHSAASTSKTIDYLLEKAFKSNRNKDSAIYYCQVAYNLSVAHKDTPNTCRALLRFASVYRDNGNMNKAINASINALKLSERIKDSIGMARAYIEIGLIYRFQDKFNLAISYIKRAALLANSPDYDLRYTYHTCIAGAYAYNHQRQLALFHYKTCLNIALKVKTNKRMLCGAYLNLAFVSSKDTALNYSLKALQIAEEMKEPGSISTLLSNIAIIYLDMNKPEMCLLYAEKAYKETKKYGNKDMLKYSYFTLTSAYKANGNYKKALFYKEKYMELKDSFFNTTSTQQIADMQTRYETEKKESENRLLLKENEINNLELNRRTTWLFISAALLVIISFFFYLAHNRNRIKSRLKELEAQQKLVQERERISRDLHDNVGSQLTFALMRLNEKATKKTDPETASIALTVKDTINQLRETIWTLKKDEVSIQELELRIRKYVQQLFKDDERIVCELQSTIDNKEVIISPSQSLNIFRIIQEALQNIMKHSEATQILLLLNASSQQVLELHIQDNGKGFDADKVGQESYGLIHMRERAKEIGATLDIRSTTGVGTTLSLLLPSIT